MTNKSKNPTDIRELFPSRFLSGYDLKGTTPTVKIERIVYEDVRGVDGEIKTVIVLCFEKAQKGLRLNKTIAKIIAKRYGHDTSLWLGKSLVLFATDVKAFGETHNVVRVRLPEG